MKHRNLVIGWLAAAATLAGTAAADPELVINTIASGTTDENAMADLVCQNDPSLFVRLPGTASRMINSGVGVPSDARSVGEFSGGDVAAGSLLLDPVDPAATFAGGLGIETGVCLCTGLADDDETDFTGLLSTPPVSAVFGIGIQGPNNGFARNMAEDGDTTGEGELSVEMLNFGVTDADFDAIHSSLPAGGDPAVLQFQIALAKPGFLRTTFVFGTDEEPYWIQQFNDTIAILVRNDNAANPQFTNIATLTRNQGGQIDIIPFSLAALAQCPVQFRRNRVAPAVLAAHPGTRHDIPSAPYYDHEFGGASRPLTRESIALPIGQYTIKFVVQDVNDQRIDAGLFIEGDSLDLFPVANGDYNLDGVVNAADYTIWRDNIGMTNATFSQGDGSGNGVVEVADYGVWWQNYGSTGNGDFEADFNRDGVVNAADYTVWSDNEGIATCASRFEGDADGDGDVDSVDYDIWVSQYGSGSSTSGMMTMARAPTIPAAVQAAMQPLRRAAASLGALTTGQAIPANPDIDGDGVVGETDIALLNEAILGSP